MLAKVRSIKTSSETITTPLLVPAFSSRADPYIQRILKFMEEFIVGPILISAYDVYYKKSLINTTYPNAIFLDSGGYEYSKDFDISEVYYFKDKPKKWNIKLYGEVLINIWPHNIPTIAICYDYNKKGMSINKQINSAKNFFKGKSYFLSDILLKPEDKKLGIIEVDSVINQIDSLKDFDIIGFTEKEIGDSVLDRMTNIAKLRIAMGKANINKPIHIFGSLDPISAPLYFVSGADIFDSLTWIRFSYFKGMAIYQNNYAILKQPLDYKTERLISQSFVDNIRVLKFLQMQMKKYISTGGNFEVFEYNSDPIERAYQALKTRIGGEL
ncbi:hypothetical protein E3V08_04105 [Candidatus Atribacteria bacterium MT.SAG.1]|nr:hypothetical protein E3V08_04105 [Candidatus Atribacteria bacterium MT.SAG.1]